MLGGGGIRCRGGGGFRTLDIVVVQLLCGVVVV